VMLERVYRKLKYQGIGTGAVHCPQHGHTNSSQ
jgi:hypothetical protein